jgi:hypothetical protein
MGNRGFRHPQGELLHPPIHAHVINIDDPLGWQFFNISVE